MTEPTIVTYRGHAIDLAPYLEGFPYTGFQALPNGNLLLYFHDLPDQRVLKAQPLDLPFDPTIGQVIGDVDWNTRNFWNPQYHRAKDAIYFQGDEANDEGINVYCLSTSSGVVTRLTDVPYVKTFALSPDQGKLAYVARYSNQGITRNELRTRDLASGADRLVLDDTPDLRFSWGKILWGGEDHLLVQANVADDRSRANLAWIDLNAPTLKPLLDPGLPRLSVTLLDAWLDANTALIVSDESGYQQVYRLDVRDSRLTPLTDEPYGYRSVLAVSFDHQVRVVTIGDRPMDSPIRVFDPASRQIVWEHVADGAVSLLGAWGDTVYAEATSLVERWSEWRLSLADPIRWERIAALPAEVTRATSHASVEKMTYPTFDVDPSTGQTRQIHAFLLIPRELPPPAQRQAFVLAFYGGHNTYDARLQILAQAGFIVLSPAVRGSFGFGRAFSLLTDKDLGGNDILDLISGARYLQDRFELAPHQIGVFGGSHGGYATVRALTLPNSINGYAESFDWGFGWAHAGFYDIPTFWRDGNLPDFVLQKVGDPRTEPEKLRDRSPLSHADRLQAPLHLTHGDRDNRVPVNQSRLLAARLDELGKTFAYDEFAGHGHGLKGIAAQRRLWSGLFAFLETKTR